MKTEIYCGTSNLRSISKLEVIRQLSAAIRAVAENESDTEFLVGVINIKFGPLTFRVHLSEASDRDDYISVYERKG